MLSSRRVSATCSTLPRSSVSKSCSEEPRFAARLRDRQRHQGRVDLQHALAVATAEEVLLQDLEALAKEYRNHDAH